jgi:two-component system sensor histidine kinase RstB
VLLLVHDDGEGVPKEHRNRVWEPFARLDDSRNRDSGGFGLGLAIVQRIIDWHGGAARVEDSANLGGAMFVTTWPVEAPAASAA